MIVVADSGPINYLVQIGRIEIIPALYDGVVIPRAVVQEMLHARTPEVVRRWIASPPAWLEVYPAVPMEESFPDNLGLGEREAISLALNLRAGRILLDDKRARIAAKRRSLQVTGTLTVLSVAASQGWIDLPAAIQELLRLDFRASTALIRAALAEDAERRLRRP